MKRITVKGATIVRVDGPVHLIAAGGQVSVKKGVVSGEILHLGFLNR